MLTILLSFDLLVKLVRLSLV